MISKQKQILGFIALAIAMFMGTLDSTIINIALPDIMQYFHASLNDSSWISTIYVLGLSVFMIPASKIADQFGRKKVMLIGLILFGSSSALCGLSQSLIFLIGMRLIQGIGGAIITPIVVPMALELFGREKTQIVAGSVGAVTALAAAGGPPLGGLLIKYLNWQFIFFVNVPFALLSLLLTALFVKESYDKTVSKSIDWLGILLLTSTLFLLTFSLLKGKDYGWTSTAIIGMFIGSAVSLALFVLAESKVKAPLVELSLFKEFTFTASSICYLITGFGIVGPLLIFNYFLQNALGYEALSAAYIVMAVSLTVIVSMPLGSVISGKLGARPVNCCGVLCMGVGAFMLSRLTMTTSKADMIADMIVCGVGLGFSCQSMVSSIKHLPEEKSGIGSGIVNAARQIGTCIGIALLVSVLNSTVTDAKNQIKSDAIDSVQQTAVDDTVKATIIQDIEDTDNDTTESSQDELRCKMENDIQNSLESLSTASRPLNDTLAKVYDGASTLSDGTHQASDGQQTLNTGAQSLNSGLDTLEGGSQTLTTGLQSLVDSLSRTLTGAQTLDSASSQGLAVFHSGVGKLNDGAQTLLSQFSSGASTGTATLYDGVNGVADGAQTLSSGLNNYVSAVNTTYYLMIKTNPASVQLLSGYKHSLTQATAAYSGMKDEQQKEQCRQQIQALSNLVALYTAGTDKSVTNEQQFEAQLQSLAAKQTGSQTGSQTSSQNIVGSGKQLTDGADKLTKASRQVSEQFTDRGAFKNGVEQVANGISQLNQNSSLSELQGGISKLSDALSLIKSGSDKALAGSQKLQNGLLSAKDGSDRLLSGSNQLVDADAKIDEGASKLVVGVSAVGQGSSIQDTVSQIESNKDEKIAGAFDRTFLLCAVILILTSVFGLFTDRKEE